MNIDDGDMRAILNKPKLVHIPVKATPLELAASLTS
jgi:hypothetical protein